MGREENIIAAQEHLRTSSQDTKKKKKGRWTPDQGKNWLLADSTMQIQIWKGEGCLVIYMQGKRRDEEGDETDPSIVSKVKNQQNKVLELRPVSALHKKKRQEG